MGDRLRLVRFPHPAKRPSVVLDLADDVTYIPTRDTLAITAPPKKRVMSASDRRYAGSRQVAESHENLTMSRTIKVRGANANAALAAFEAVVVATENFRGLLLEWRPDGASYSTYLELRGPADYNPAYSWAQFAGARSWETQFVFPCAPLARHDCMDVWDDFAVDSIVDYAFDVGAGALAVSGGQLVPSSTTEKVLYHAARGYEYSDVQATLKFTTGATVPAASIGLVLRRLDGNNFLRAAVIPDTGTVDLFKKDGGTFSALGSPTAGTALSTGTPYWLRGRVEGNVVTVELFTAEPTPLSTPLRTATHTLSGADATKFGTGVVGEVGIRTNNVPTDYRYDDFRVEPYTYRARTLPTQINLGGAVPGTAPALADLIVTTSGSPYPVWALFALARTPGAPIASNVAPFGVVEGETGQQTGLTIVTSSGIWRGNGGYKVATGTGGGTGSLYIPVDPSTMLADEFSDDIAIEVFARVRLDAGVVSPKLTLEAKPAGGLGRSRYANESWGSAGRVLTRPSSGTVFRMARLGTVRLDTRFARSWLLGAQLAWAAGSSGDFGIDYFVFVPVTRRAASPTNKANDSGYPQFVTTTSERTKVITSALAAFLSDTTADTGYQDTSLIGEPLELPPGNVSLVAEASDLVPDDPTASTASDALGQTASLHVRVTPRSFLVRGS